MRIGFVGISHLSLCTGITFSSTGNEVVFFDPRKQLLRELKNKNLPIFEPGLDLLFDKNFNQISFVSEADTLSECDIVYYAIDVKTDKTNLADLSQLTELLELTVSSINGPIIIHSQVSVGFCRNIIERFSLNPINVFYQVETLIFGKAVDRVLHPERFIIGCFDKKNINATFNNHLDKFKCPIFYMKYETAELAKMANNMFLVSTVSTTNLLASICENVGANWHDIKESLKLDKRIGKYAYIEPGLGISGGNLERDMVAISNLSKKFLGGSEMVDSWFDLSYSRKDWPINRINEILEGNSAITKIAIWGLSYIKNTSSTKNSPSLTLINKLEDYMVSVYDPLAKLDYKESLYKNVIQYKDIYESLEDADVLVIMTPWDIFSNIEKNKFIRHFSGKYIIDPFQAISFDLPDKELFVLGK